ncbi:MAG: phosphatidate cytidylyltransferase [Campylobacterales bacterium]
MDFRKEFKRWVKQEEELAKRIFTGLGIGAGLVAVGVLNNPYLIKLLFGVLALIGGWEVSRFFTHQLVGVWLAGVAGALLVFLPPLPTVLGILIIGVGIVAYSNFHWGNLIPLIYPLLPLGIGVDLYQQSGIGVLVWLILVIALTDIGAFIIGRNLGREFFQQGFSPTSPKKSWEGVIGGILAASIGGGLLGLLFLPAWEGALVAGIVGVGGVLGDLFESYLKRLAGVKDSGSFLPGHGGVLDRIDSHLFGFVVGWIFTQIGLF